MNNQSIDISVYILTYFHEKYIAQAIESVLCQRTDFSYEIVISDDCSKDKTREIIESYRCKYPDIIRVIYNEENMGIPRNIYQARCNCRGKYIVGLSGDDYWINESKLEIEASFLEKHDQYLAVFNGIELRYDYDLFPYDTVPKKRERNQEFSLKDYEAGKILRSHGFMMRNLFLEDAGREYFKQAQLISDKVDDAVDVVLIMRRGKVFIIDEVTDAHRVIRNENGEGHNYNSKYKRIEKFAQYIELLNRMDGYFNKSSLVINFRKKYESAIVVAELDAIYSKQFSEYKKVFRTIPNRYTKPRITSVFISAIPKCFIFVIRRGINRIKAKVKRQY